MTTTTTIHYITRHYNHYNYNYNYTNCITPRYTTHYTTLRYTTLIALHYTTLHHTTLNCTTLHYPTPHCIALHYTHCTTTNATATALTAALHHTTSSSCGWGDRAGDHCNHCSHSKKHSSNHLSVHQWIRSAIRDSQQPISPIGFLFLKLPPPPCAVLLVVQTHLPTLCGRVYVSRRGGNLERMNFMWHSMWTFLPIWGWQKLN